MLRLTNIAGLARDFLPLLIPLPRIAPEFFGVLASPSARLCVDVLDALEREAGQRTQRLDREGALALNPPIGFLFAVSRPFAMLRSA